MAFMPAAKVLGTCLRECKPIHIQTGKNVNDLSQTEKLI